jgi:cell pole-organizing protein PopZ
MVQDEIDALMAPERQESGVLDLTEAMTAAPSPPPAPARNDGFRTIDGQSDIVFEEGPEEPPPPPLPPEPRRYAQEAVDHRPLISSSTSAAVDSAFNSLAQTVLVHNAQTLEDLVREMLRPLLKTWLDDNLPGLVERLVRSEIERVSRGRK